MYQLVSYKYIIILVQCVKKLASNRPDNQNINRFNLTKKHNIKQMRQTRHILCKCWVKTIKCA